MEALFAILAALFILFVLEIVPGYLFYNLGGGAALALFVTLEMVRFMINYFTAKNEHK